MREASVAWEPTRYLQFSDHRLRPALDLLSRLAPDAPGAIRDLGCGTGNITRLLAERWPEAAVVGVDSSAEMLEVARRADPEGRIGWVCGDIARDEPGAPVDLLFSNAALHWLDDHRALFPRLVSQLAPGGWLAVQMPHNHAAPSHVAMAEAAVGGPWAEAVGAVLRPSPVGPPALYYDVLSPLVRELDLWETEYLHVLDGDDPVVAWTRGTALRPLLDAAGAHADAFLAAYTERIRAAYPRRADGRTLLPFRRLFLVARR